MQRSESALATRIDSRSMRQCITMLICFALMSCSRPEGSGWKLISQLTDGLEIQFVEVAKEKAQSRATYDEAVRSLCQGRAICVIGFFQAGDRIPEAHASKAFFDNEGFKHYPTLAVWWGNRNTGLADFTEWDCVRAGAAGAPLDALCGEYIREAYAAILKIAERNGLADACHWPAGEGKATAAKFLASINEPKRRKQFEDAYEQHYRKMQNGPDNVSDCRRLRQTIEEQTRQASKFLRSISGAGLH